MIRMSYFDFFFWLLTLPSCECKPYEAAVMDQVIGFLTLTWETWTEFLTYDLGIGSALVMMYIAGGGGGRVTQQMEGSLYLSLT